MANATYTPLILSATFVPNPVKSGEALLLQVMALDVEIAEKTETRMSGEFYSGEV